jgi:hypothetical protein
MYEEERADEQGSEDVYGAAWCGDGFVCGAVVVLVVVFDSYPTAPWRVVVAVVPVVPIALGVLAFVRFLRQMDELQRRIQLEGLAFAFGGTALVTFTYGFLQIAGLPALSWIWVFPLMCALWGCGLALAAWRYR